MSRLRSCHPGNATSRPISAVKQDRALSSTVVGDHTETKGDVILFFLISKPWMANFFFTSLEVGKIGAVKQDWPLSSAVVGDQTETKPKKKKRFLDF